VAGQGDARGGNASDPTVPLGAVPPQFPAFDQLLLDVETPVHVKLGATAPAGGVETRAVAPAMTTTATVDPLREARKRTARRGGRTT